MENCLPHFDLDGITENKCKESEDKCRTTKLIWVLHVFIFLILGLYNYSFQGNSSQCYSAQLEFSV